MSYVPAKKRLDAECIVSFDALEAGLLLARNKLRADLTALARCRDVAVICRDRNTQVGEHCGVRAHPLCERQLEVGFCAATSIPPTWQT